MQTRLPRSWIVRKDGPLDSQTSDESELSQAPNTRGFQWTRVMNRQQMVDGTVRTYDINGDIELDSSINKIR